MVRDAAALRGEVRERCALQRTGVNNLRAARTWHLCPQRKSKLTQLLVLIVVAPFLTSLGTEPEVRLQNHTLMNEFVRSMAYQPPPALLNALPKLFEEGALTPQPALFVAAVSQLLPVLVL